MIAKERAPKGGTIVWLKCTSDGRGVIINARVLKIVEKTGGHDVRGCLFDVSMTEYLAVDQTLDQIMSHLGFADGGSLGEAAPHRVLTARHKLNLAETEFARRSQPFAELDLLRMVRRYRIRLQSNLPSAFGAEPERSRRIIGRIICRTGSAKRVTIRGRTSTPTGG